jgi:hypothetical protein
MSHTFSSNIPPAVAARANESIDAIKASMRTLNETMSAKENEELSKRLGGGEYTASFRMCKDGLFGSMTHVNSGTKATIIIKKSDNKTWSDCQEEIMTDNRCNAVGGFHQDDCQAIMAYTSAEQYTAFHETFIGWTYKYVPSLEKHELPTPENLTKITWASLMIGALWWKMLATIYLAEMDKADTDGLVAILAHKAKIAHNQLSVSECLLEVSGDPIVKFL